VKKQVIELKMPNSAGFRGKNPNSTARLKIPRSSEKLWALLMIEQC